MSTGGHQPLSNEDGSVWVSFNGEIYNHPQLRDELRARGHVFQTSADTEVIVHLYEEYGDALVHALEGMFGLALWDERRGRLLIARDRFGEKPMFLHEQGGELTFASELSALLAVTPQLRELDPQRRSTRSSCSPTCPVRARSCAGVRQLPPGHMLTWERGRRRVQREQLGGRRASARRPAASASSRSPPRPSICSRSRSARAWSPMCLLASF